MDFLAISLAAVVSAAVAMGIIGPKRRPGFSDDDLDELDSTITQINAMADADQRAADDDEVEKRPGSSQVGRAH